MKTSRKSVSKRVTSAKTFSEKDLKDLKTLEEIKAGNINAYEFIYKRYYQFIQYHCFLSVKDQQISNDLASEILTKIYLNIDKYKVNYTFNSWVWSIVKNYLIDYTRKRKSEPLNHNRNSSIIARNSENDELSLNTLCSSEIDSGYLNPEELTLEKNVNKMRKDFVNNLLNNISERERLILTYYYFEDMSYEEIAEKLDMGLSSMKVTLMRAKEKLKNRIGSMDNIAHLITAA